MPIVGNIRRISAVFTVGATETNPTVTTVRVRTPAGVETSYVYGTDAEVIRTATGRFYFDLTGTETGEYLVRFTGTGTVVAADSEKVRFTTSGFSS
jgi:hypothetical protein